MRKLQRVPFGEEAAARTLLWSVHGVLLTEEESTVQCSLQTTLYIYIHIYMYAYMYIYAVANDSGLSTRASVFMFKCI